MLSPEPHQQPAQEKPMSVGMLGHRSCNHRGTKGPREGSLTGQAHSASPHLYVLCHGLYWHSGGEGLGYLAVELMGRVHLS